MTDRQSAPSELPAFVLALTRRRLLAGLGTSAVLSGLAALPIAEAAAQEATPLPTPVDQARLTNLNDLSRTLCGGGNFDPGRATTLLGLLDGDAALKQGLDELLAAPPVDPATSVTPAAAPAAVPSAQAQATSQAILLYWYVGEFNGEPGARPLNRLLRLDRLAGDVHAAVRRLQALRRLGGPAVTVAPGTRQRTYDGEGPTNGKPPTTYDCDVAIVGAGIAGALIGWRLATAGAKVIMLEAGLDGRSQQGTATAFSHLIVDHPRSGLRDPALGADALRPSIPNNYWSRPDRIPSSATTSGRSAARPGTGWAPRFASSRTISA